MVHQRLSSRVGSHPLTRTCRYGVVDTHIVLADNLCGLRPPLSPWDIVEVEEDGEDELEDLRHEYHSHWSHKRKIMNLAESKVGSS